MELPGLELSLPKPGDILDRDAEWRALQVLWDRPRPQLAFVLGRRRIGKSYVLARFARQVQGLYYQATKRTEAEQLAHLSRICGERFDDAALRQGVGFPSWERLFGYITEQAGGRPFLLVLDEFPYLAAAAPALPSLLQSAWDHLWPASRIKVVLSGSFVTAMRALEEADQPLYGRRTSRLVFGPFDFMDAAAFMPGLSFHDRLIGYAAFGNLPGHLAFIDPAEPIAGSIGSALLDPSGPLVDEAQHMLDAFLAEARMHASILEAVALGEQSWSGITRRVGQAGGALLRPLRWLIEMGLLERVVPISEKVPQRSKRALYRITDPYLVFWHRMVAPLLQTGSIGLVPPDTLWQQLVLPRLGEHLGQVFEEVCRQHVRRGKGLPFTPVRVGEWWDATSQQQVDIVALGARGELLVAEAKWGAVTHEHLRTLAARAQRIAGELGGAPEVHLALFSGSGEADATVQAEAAAGRVLYVRGEELGGPGFDT